MLSGFLRIRDGRKKRGPLDARACAVGTGAGRWKGHGGLSLEREIETEDETDESGDLAIVMEEVVLRKP